jgi:dsRNA-specific ribonuclease
MPKFYEQDVETVNNHKIFKVCLKDSSDNIISIGSGSNKKEAENDAASKALEALCVEFQKL